MLKKIHFTFIILTALLGSLIILSSPSNASPLALGEVLPLGATFYLASGSLVSYVINRENTRYICKLTDTTVIKPRIVLQGEGAFKIINYIKQDDSSTFIVYGTFVKAGKGWLVVTNNSYGKGNIVCNKA